jgi:hypothetical protein
MDSPEFSVFGQQSLTVAELVRVRGLAPKLCVARTLTSSATVWVAGLARVQRD